jgi:hypothetical protein
LVVSNRRPLFNFRSITSEAAFCLFDGLIMKKRPSRENREKEKID